MSNNSVFNATVCMFGIAILLIHIVNLSIKPDKRKDEKYLFVFFVFTAIHFATYLAFTFLKENVSSDAFIMGFYTTFYIFNNIEVLLLFAYVVGYIDMPLRTKQALVVTNLILFIFFVFLDISNIFTKIFFYAQNGVYIRSKTMIISQLYQFIAFAIVFVITIINKKLNLREKIAFSIYCFLPLVAIVLQNMFKGYAIAYASIIISIEILFFFVNVQKNIDLSREKEKNKEAHIKIMMSQIQPHFIYNALSSISTLIPIDPKKAQKSLDDFTDYLRMNLASLTETRLVPFKNELKHIETYIALEKMRFNDRINIIYDIEAEDFNIPPLSIQPIVENALKHGILKKIEGGTLKFSTKETDEAYIVIVEDDGVGFDMDSVDFTNNTHFGINNIKQRLATMCRSDMDIESKPNVGTKVTITFYK